MDIDLDLYRQEVRISANLLVRLSAIDISPDHPQRTFVFIHALGADVAQRGFQRGQVGVDVGDQGDFHRADCTR
ncbi:MAG: hypothetical protein PGMFKBFP_02881 [Anaerolineales bacterium]|nr:hypothetical protein [Anaerolineales bacterium]